MSDILTEESKPVADDVLSEIERLSDAMGIGGARFVRDLHASYDRQHGVTA